MLEVTKVGSTVKQKACGGCSKRFQQDEARYITGKTLDSPNLAFCKGCYTVAKYEIGDEPPPAIATWQIQNGTSRSYLKTVGAVMGFFLYIGTAVIIHFTIQFIVR